MKKRELNNSLYLLGSIVMALILVVAMQSCNSVKRVLSDPAKTETVGREWEKINPCNNDTFVVSKADTTATTDTVYSTIADTTILDGKETIVIKKVPQIITRVVTIRDTIKSFVVDNRRLYIALDSVAYYKEFKGKFEQQILLTTIQHHRATKWIIFFWLVVAVVVFNILKNLPFKK